ncbi:MAG: hypothetical protein JWO37_1807 [Acidimicrobiales bacterium]|jgi:cell wall-associated NlpC family hydrolase|nr:hypothetical protein [Acidimicrobiales bacterium]
MAPFPVAGPAWYLSQPSVGKVRLATASNAPVVASADGVVEYYGPNGDVAATLIGFDGTTYAYRGLERAASWTESGQEVTVGAVIGFTTHREGPLVVGAGSDAFTRVEVPVGPRAVAVALRALGTPYVWGGTSPGTGLDCSGLVQWAYGEVGIRVPRTTFDQARRGVAVTPRDLRPGDLIFRRGGPSGDVRDFGHVAMYVGGHEEIQAPYAGQLVSIRPIDFSNIQAIRRVVPDAPGFTFEVRAPGSGETRTAAKLDEWLDGALERARAVVSVAATNTAPSPVGPQPVAHPSPSAPTIGLDYTPRRTGSSAPSSPLGLGVKTLAMVLTVVVWPVGRLYRIVARTRGARRR